LRTTQQQWLCYFIQPNKELIFAAFMSMITRYEREGRGRRVVPARKLWDHIISSQIETGTPYMLYKDSCNRKSNQQNLGTITCSNLCTEIIEYCDADEVYPLSCDLVIFGLAI